MLLEQAHASRRMCLASYFVSPRKDSLVRILEPGRNTGVWRRSLAPSLQLWLDTLARQSTFELSSSQTVSLPDLPASEPLRAWVRDITRLVALFRSLTGAPRVKTSLATVTTDKCRKFHTDYKSLRMVCTYSGPGTEWVDDRDVARDEMGHEESCFDRANARIVPVPTRIQRAAAGDVVVLKGERFAENRGRGAVHRSPSIERTAERRIVLTLDVD